MFGYKENHKERTSGTRYVTFRRNGRVAERKPVNTSIARVFVTPEAAAELLRLSSAASSHAKTSLLPIKRNTVRKPLRRAPVVSTRKEANQTEEPHEIEVRRQARPIRPENSEVEDSRSQLEITTVNRKDARLNTARLRRFALEKLPKESVLRQVVLAEKEELTPEEFVARIEIWFRLLNQ
jgi:hypothetical protein